MNRRRRKAIGRVRVVSMTAVAVALGLASGGQVAAECEGPVPSFAKVAPTAQTVVIADVTSVRTGGEWEPGPDGWSSRFTIAVRHVLRGTAPTVMEITDLPTQPCATVVLAGVGDRIALALDGMDFSPPIPVNTVAWVRGTPPNGDLWFETATMGEVFALFGLEAPTTSTTPADARPPGGIAPATILGGALLGVGFAGVLVGRRSASRQPMLAARRRG